MLNSATKATLFVQKASSATSSRIGLGSHHSTAHHTREDPAIHIGSECLVASFSDNNVDAVTDLSYSCRLHFSILRLVASELLFTHTHIPSSSDIRPTPLLQHLSTQDARVHDPSRRRRYRSAPPDRRRSGRTRFAPELGRPRPRSARASACSRCSCSLLTSFSPSFAHTPHTCYVMPCYVMYVHVATAGVERVKLSSNIACVIVCSSATCFSPIARRFTSLCALDSMCRCVSTCTTCSLDSTPSPSQQHEHHAPRQHDSSAQHSTAQ